MADSNDPNNEARERALSGAAWNDFCDALKGAGATIVADDAPSDPLDRAEGFRYLARLTRIALGNFLEFNDPTAPMLHRPVHETAKIGADNPDNYYMHATISGDYEYRISGTRGSVNYLGFGAQSPGVASTGDTQQSAYLEAADMEIGPNGEIEIWLSQQEKPGNWIKLAPNTEALIVRQTFLDRDTEVPAELKIERVGADARPDTFSPERLAGGLQQASGFVAGCSALFANWTRGFMQHANQLPQFDPGVSLGAGGDPNIVYYHSYWELGPEEALVIDAQPPACDSWNFQLDNWWMESLDYRFHRIHVNKHTAEYADDGSVRIIVTHRDPGLPNWVDTAGHARGTMCFRWIGASEHPQPATRVVKVSELAGL